MTLERKNFAKGPSRSSLPRGNVFRGLFSGIRQIPLSALAVAFFSFAAFSHAADRVVGANASLDIEPGARSAALGSATAAIDGDYLGLTSNPQQLANVNYAWASFSHTQYYEDSKYDFASAVVPLGEGQGLGIAFARFGADDIPCIKDGEPLPEGSNYNTLSIADWMFSVSFGKKLFGRLDLGASFHTLYRDMDQSGFGFRGDLGARYRVVDQFYVSGLLKGWTSSAVTWDSGEFEYTSPELYLAASYSRPVPYLYGKLGVYWQSAGVFHQENRELDFEDDADGGRVWESPLDWLSGGRGGLEFAFDFGLTLRAGLSSFTSFQSVTAGAGLVIAKFLKVDYAFESHPVLSPVHRVSISVSPYLFAKKPRPGTPEAAEGSRKPALLTEETEEDLYEESREEIPEEIREASAEEAPRSDSGSEEVQASGVPHEERPVETVSKQPQGVVVETDDEILE